MRLIKAMWPCLKYRDVAKPQRTQKGKTETVITIFHHSPTHKATASFYAGCLRFCLEKSTHISFRAVQLQQEWSLSPPNSIVFSREVLWWANLESNAHLYQSEARGKHGQRSHLPSQFLEGRAEQITQEVPAAATLIFVLCYLKHLNDPASLELPYPHWLPVLWMDNQSVHKSGFWRSDPAPVLMLPDLYVFPLKSTKSEVSPWVYDRLRLLLKWLYRGKPH